MESIITWIKSIAVLITAITTICLFCKKAINKGFEPINKKIDKLDKNQSKNYLTEFLADVKNGVHKDENQIARATEVYDHYIKDLNGNSYIHTSWEKIMIRGERK